jgi:hypothetical protein
VARDYGKVTKTVDLTAPAFSKGSVLKIPVRSDIHGLLRDPGTGNEIALGHPYNLFLCQCRHSYP